MALELMPDGTFKKLSKIQTDALDRYYKREKKVTKEFSTEAGLLLVGYGVPTVMVATIAAAAFIFRDQIKEEALTRLEEGAIFSGLGVAKVLTFIARAAAPTVKGGPEQEPREPEIGPQGETLTRCQRYEADYVADNELHTVAFIGTPLQALAQLNTIQKMKKEGCSRPSIIPQGQWDQG